MKINKQRLKKIIREEFEKVNASSEEGIRELLGVPDNFFVIFVFGSI